MTVKPEIIKDYEREENVIYLNCDRGEIKLGLYGENILHFAYFPENRRKLPLWGFKECKTENIPFELEDNHFSFSLRTSQMEVSLEKSGGNIKFRDREGNCLLTSKDYSLCDRENNEDDLYEVNLSFVADEKEHYYGLGQHQEGHLDMRGEEVILWHDYSHKRGEVVAVPFLVTDNHYGLIFDNCSRSKVYPGKNGETVWFGEKGEAVSFFFIYGEKTDDIYKGYRRLIGQTPMPPKSGLGFIQCKQRYASSIELLNVARKYREKGYPCDILVVDWFHWKVLGDLSLDESYWPDPVNMNKELETMGFETMISCWPRFMKESKYYKTLEENQWFMHDDKNNIVYGTREDQRGALIDTTNPECGKWYWDTIRKNYGEKGFRYWWTDENEPDISPYDFHLYAGPGDVVHNLYPLTHTESIFQGHRSSYDYRCLILSRAAYLGAQRCGTTFWSSDIFPEWDVLERQIPAGLNFCASGFPYWSSDIGGWHPLEDEESDEDFRTLLVDTENENGGGVNKSNYVELYIRWFQFGAFCPTFRTHGTRKENEVWSYGVEAEKILVKFLELRYKLMPYIYSLAFQSYQTGAPFMRALWMDYDDELAADIKDEYMFGPGMLIAPVTKKGMRFRDVYLPGDRLWYNFWTNESFTGRQTITVDAPIDSLPIFIPAGAIIPMGEVVESTKIPQTDLKLSIYSGANGSFPLYSDDGKTYAYEKGDYCLTHIYWDNDSKEISIENDNRNIFNRKQSEYIKIIK